MCLCYCNCAVILKTHDWTTLLVWVMFHYYKQHGHNCLSRNNSMGYQQWSLLFHLTVVSWKWKQKRSRFKCFLSTCCWLDSHCHLRDFHFYIIIITPLLDIYRTWGLLCFTCISTRRKKTKKTSGLWCYPVLVWRRSARDGCGVLWCGTQAGAGQSPHLCTRCSLRGGRRRRNTTGVRWGETTVKIQMMESGMSVNSVEMWRRAHWMWVRVCEVCWPQRHGSE